MYNFGIVNYGKDKEIYNQIYNQIKIIYNIIYIYE